MRDMRAAYKQIPVNEEDKCSSITCVWNPSSKQWVFGELLSLAFGQSLAVIGFNRVPAFLVAVARRFLAIPCIHFYDDFKVVDMDEGGAEECFDELMSTNGFLFDKEKDQSSCTHIINLGREERFFWGSAAPYMEVRLAEERRQTILSSIDSVLRVGSCSATQCNSLRGRLLNARGCFRGRCLFGPMGLYDGPLSARDRAQLLFFKEALQCSLPKRFFLSTASRKRIISWSDASWEPGPSGPVCRLCWMLSLDGMRFGRVYDVPSAFWARCIDRTTQIVIAEALAVILLIRDGLCGLKGHALTGFVDNIAVLCGFVMGYSRSADLAALYLAASARLSSLDISTWWEWVPSESNVSDGGSRVGTSCSVASALGIHLSRGSFPSEWPCLDLYSSDSWTLWWDQW